MSLMDRNLRVIHANYSRMIPHRPLQTAAKEKDDHTQDTRAGQYPCDAGCWLCTTRKDREDVEMRLWIIGAGTVVFLVAIALLSKLAARLDDSEQDKDTTRNRKDNGEQ